MAGQLRLRRGTTSQIANYRGAQGELTYDTALKSLVLHDGVTLGGVKIPYLSNNLVPSTMLPTATESVIGISKIATTAIAQAGTNDTDIITAKKLRDALNATGNAPVYAIRAMAMGNCDTAVPTVVRSLNISTVTKLDYLNLEFTFTTPMADANYIVIGLGSDQVLNTLGIGGSFVDYNKTTTGFKVKYSFSDHASKADAYSYRIVVL